MDQIWKWAFESNSLVICSLQFDDGKSHFIYRTVRVNYHIFCLSEVIIAPFKSELTSIIDEICSSFTFEKFDYSNHQGAGEISITKQIQSKRPSNKLKETAPPQSLFTRLCVTVEEWWWINWSYTIKFTPVGQFL